MSNKEHWEKIYTTKTQDEVSWTEAKPITSLEQIAAFGLPKFAKIIDIGGGDSNLVDNLIDLGYTNITVLDISQAAIQRAKTRLGDKADKVKWIVSDIRDFNPPVSYDLWHDRATFHFLTKKVDINKYVYWLTNMGIVHVVLGTFSKRGPLKCSGLEITQYDKEKVQAAFGQEFKLLDFFTKDHTTPFGTIQNFTFTRMTRKGGF